MLIYNPRPGTVEVIEFSKLFSPNPNQIDLTTKRYGGQIIKGVKNLTEQ
jgi:hypothetical protein